MKKLPLRVLSCLLAVMTLLLSAAVFNGCGNDTQNPETTTAAPAGSQAAATTVEEDTSPVFPEADFNNEDFTVYMRSESASSYPSLYIYAEDVSDTMSSAVYQRNANVEEKYKVKINVKQADDPNKTVSADIAGGVVDYDLLLDRRSSMASIARAGCLYNYHNLDIDYSAPWWDSNCAKGYDINGKLFFMANDISISNLGGARFFYFNKQLVTDNNLTSPYDYVASNSWTLDNFLNMVSVVYSDVDGDGKKSYLDTYGLCVETGESNGNHMHLLTGCGVKYTEFSDGALITTANTEKTGDILTKVAAVIKGGSTITYGDLVASDPSGKGEFANNYDYGRSIFAAGRFLFIQGNMNVASQFAQMENDYGVVPNPKYDSTQENYYHKMDKYSIIFAIPNYTSVNYDRLALVTDFWAYQSSQTVMPAYYEITIKTKRVQEATASQMLDIVKDTIVYDLSDLFGISIASALNTAYDTGNLSSSWKALSKNIDISLEKLISDMDALE